MLRNNKMVNHKIFTPTNYKTRVDLLPSELEKGKIDEFLLQRLKQEYEGLTIKDGNVMGYVKPGSLKLVERSRAFMTGSHFTGILCCNVVINFDLYTPILNKVVEARVVKKTPIGFTAQADPLRIIVAKTTTFEQPNDLFENIEPDLLIPIEILHFQLRRDHIYAVGRLRPFQENYAKSYEINISKLPVSEFYRLQPPNSLSFSTSIPKQDESYGDPSKLNEAKDNLSDNSDPDKVTYWEYYMKQYLNDYEIIGNNNYFLNSLVYSISPMPINRAYYKLVEILHDEQLLKDFEDEAINVLLLGEAPGGFIQAMIETRQNPQDKLIAVTARANDNEIKFDWDTEGEAKKYLDQQRNLTRELKDLTESPDIRDIINSNKNSKMQIITSDGGIDVVENDNYNWQERMNYKLFYGEILTAIGCQAINGHYVMKIYDIYTNVTNQLIHLLANVYETVTITKPKTSRPANSERYLVCKNFRGLHDFPLDKHLAQLEEWNIKEKELKISGNEPFTQRNFYINDLVIIALDSQTTALIKEKNQLFVKRQLESLKKGTERLEQFRGSVWSDSDKINDATERMGQQIQNALMWCKEYLQNNSCKSIPSPNISYYQKQQGPQGQKVGPLVPSDTSSRRSRNNESSSSSSGSSGSYPGSSGSGADVTASRVSTRGRGSGSARGSARGSIRGLGRGAPRARDTSGNNPEI
jgi:23S rRNA U2552 (ribose-2'-O)-methylase RlmE/FtsJ/DNA-directed RNA polymerase subunit E'/Rpb7